MLAADYAFHRRPCLRNRMQSLFRAAHQERPHRHAMGLRWQADLVRPEGARALGNGRLHARNLYLYRARFNLRPATRSSAFKSESVGFLGDGCGRSFLYVEDGGALKRAVGWVEPLRNPSCSLAAS